MMYVLYCRHFFEDIDASKTKAWILMKKQYVCTAAMCLHERHKSQQSLTAVIIQVVGNLLLLDYLAYAGILQ